MPKVNNKEIGTIECPGCGSETPVKINSVGCVYYFCAKPMAHDENGKVTERCYTRMNYGRRASEKIIAEYGATETGALKHEDTGIETEEKTATEPAGHEHIRTEPAEPTDTEQGSRGSIAGTVKQWFE